LFPALHFFVNLILFIQEGGYRKGCHVQSCFLFGGICGDVGERGERWRDGEREREKERRRKRKSRDRLRERERERERLRERGRESDKEKVKERYVSTPTCSCALPYTASVGSVSLTVRVVLRERDDPPLDDCLFFFFSVSLLDFFICLNFDAAVTFADAIPTRAAPPKERLKLTVFAVDRLLSVAGDTLIRPLFSVPLLPPPDPSWSSSNPSICS